MVYAISDLVREVRVAIDQNMSSATLAGLGDVDTLSLEGIIESKIADAVRIVENGAPVSLLDGGKVISGSVTWHGAAGNGSGEVSLPSDFLRLVSFKMSDWSYAVTVPIDETHPLYSRQHSRYPGVRGCPQRPVVAIASRPNGLALEFFSCTGGTSVQVESARYLPIPVVDDGSIDLCEKLKPAIVYYCAYLTALSIKEGELATGLLNTSKELMGLNEG